MAGSLELPAASTWIRRKGYRGLRLQRAMRSGFLNSSPTNRATHTLWNNSPGQYYLIVRAVNCSSTGSFASQLAYVTTPAGTSQGSVQSLIPNRANGPGLHYYSDTATTITADYGLGNGNLFGWNHEFPIAVLPPAYGLVFQPNANTITACVGFFWEYVLAEELDDWLDF